MDNLERMLEELEAKCELGMGEDALALCEKIITDTEAPNAQAFESLITAVGMFAEKCADWKPALEQWFDAFPEDERFALYATWISFLVSADVDWETIKPHVRIRQLPEEILYFVCDAASDAADKEWCSEALRLLGQNFCPQAGCAERLSRAILLTTTGNHLAALDALRGFHVELHHYQTFVRILTKAAGAHCLSSLDSLSHDIKARESSAEVEMKLPAIGRELKEDSLQMIAKARKAVDELLEV